MRPFVPLSPLTVVTPPFLHSLPAQEKWEDITFDTVLLDHYWLPDSVVWLNKGYMVSMYQYVVYEVLLVEKTGPFRLAIVSFWAKYTFFCVGGWFVKYFSD